MKIGAIVIQHGTAQVHLRTYDQRIKGRLVPMGGEEPENSTPQNTSFRVIPSVSPLSPPASSYASEHLRMKPVMDVVRASEDLRPISAGFEVYVDGRITARTNWRWNHASERIIGLDLRLFNDANAELVEDRIGKVFQAAGFLPLTCHFHPEQ
jgi:hypothetical protein